MITTPEEDLFTTRTISKPSEEPAVKGVAPATPAPPPSVKSNLTAEAGEKSFIKRLWSSLFGGGKEEEEVEEKKVEEAREHRQHDRGNGGGRGKRGTASSGRNRGGRGSGGSRGGRKSGNRGPGRQGEAGENISLAETNSKEIEATHERPIVPVVETETSGQPTETAASEAQEQQATGARSGSESRRGRRGGRRGRRGGERRRGNNNPNARSNEQSATGDQSDTQKEAASDNSNRVEASPAPTPKHEHAEGHAKKAEPVVVPAGNDQSSPERFEPVKVSQPTQQSFFQETPAVAAAPEENKRRDVSSGES
jgi:ribonuclease E